MNKAGEAQTPGRCCRESICNTHIHTEREYLGLDVIGYVVRSAAQGDLPDRPRCIIGKVGWQDADAQLPLQQRTSSGPPCSHCPHAFHPPPSAAAGGLKPRHVAGEMN